MSGSMSILKNMTPEPIKLSHAGVTYHFAGTDRVTDAPIVFWLWKKPVKIEHKTARGEFRTLPSKEVVFEKVEKGKSAPHPSAVLVDQNAHKVPTQHVSTLVAMSNGALKGFAVTAPEVVDTASKLLMEKRALESEKARLAAELAAIEEEKQLLAATKDHEIAKMRDELLAMQAKFAEKKSKG